MAIDSTIGKKLVDGNVLVSVLNKIKELLGNKVDKKEGYGLSKNDFNDAAMNKLGSLENYDLPTATKTQLGGVMVDDEISNTSTNPVQNKKVYDALGGKVNVSDIVDSLASSETNKPLSARQGMALKQQIDQINTAVSGAGTGDMLSSVYDTDGDGIVDNAKTLQGYSPEDFAESGHTHKIVDAEDFDAVSSTLALVDHTHAMTELSDYDVLDSAMNEFNTSINNNRDSITNIINAQLPLKADKNEVNSAIETVTEIANGKCGCTVFETEVALNEWLQVSENTKDLKTGHVFLIRQVSVPDYWWDATTSQACVLETTKVNLDVLSSTDVTSIIDEVFIAS